MDFGKNFVWGAATASYQVEGGAYEDGKGLNILIRSVRYRAELTITITGI